MSVVPDKTELPMQLLENLPSLQFYHGPDEHVHHFSQGGTLRSATLLGMNPSHSNAGLIGSRFSDPIALHLHLVSLAKVAPGLQKLTISLWHLNNIQDILHVIHSFPLLQHLEISISYLFKFQVFLQLFCPQNI
jgi:hypothetical protein